MSESNDMTTHDPTVVYNPVVNMLNDPDYRGICECGWKSPRWVETPLEATEYVVDHILEMRER